ncbi:T9SS type A sorting domain-containing protein [Halalkalibaculum sp. DA384]|uniref:T9SS type A sorting domain-containing protein n=1 Tax=Halalkalibaculum sp. DA384 TaxID=3373606 RepID=UPI00375449B6
MSGIAATAGYWYYQTSGQKIAAGDASPGEVKVGEPLSKIQTKAARSQYFFRMLKDPGINAIPPNIRNRELRLARQQPTRSQNPIRIKQKDGTFASLEFNWQSAGPIDVGGRTRALGIDQTNPNIIIAGGTSGGIWKSVDGGSTWDLKTDPSQHMSVTSVAQDTTEPDTWYYTSGELRGNTAGDRSGLAGYFGTGVFKSTDNGDTWSKIPSTDDNDTAFNSPYDFITRVVVSPTTGSVFIASNGIGIYRSTDSQPFPSAQQSLPPPLLGTAGGHRYVDIAAGPDGRLVAALSEEQAGGSGANPGLFVSYNDGDDWIEITPDIENFPDTYQRSVIDIAPSAPDTVYVMTYVGGSGEDEDVRLHLVDLNDLQNGGTVQSEDRTEHIPDFGGEIGYMSTQSNYNMEIAVKPDDPDFVLLGGINLFRSRDGFSSSPPGGYGDNDKNEYWIGGYAKANDISKYPQQHPDQHVIKFHPNNPNIAWAGHDGGVSKTIDITGSSVSWENMNNGYVTTQFYAVDIPETPGDERLMGGTQDNGTPFFRFNSQQSQQTQSAVNIFTGDGGHAYFTPSYLFVSAQNGNVLRWQTDPSGNPSNFAYVTPIDARNQLFIHPYAVDPNDQDIMYYPDGDSLWRNIQIGEITNSSNPDGTSEGWNMITELSSSGAGSGHLITTLEVTQTPSDILYYGAYSVTGGQPHIYRLENASTSSDARDISIPGAENGSYPHDIAANPSNGNELLAVFSNYEVPSVFHSADGGDTWQNVEGNLTSVNEQAGPSVRSATIIEGETGTIYMLGTSTGIYSTTDLEVENIQWTQEGASSIGYTVTEHLSSRNIDGTIAAGTHGRGVFKGDFQSTVPNYRYITLDQYQAAPGEKININSTNLDFNPEGNIVLFSNTPAEIESISENQLTVIVPRVSNRVMDSQNANTNKLVQVQVKVGDQTISALQGFEILPPEEFELGQNFPNPFNPTTTIPIDLPTEAGVIIQIYDMSGRKVLEPVRRIYPPDNYNFEVDLSGLASGVYMYRVIALPQGETDERIIKTRKMTLIK